MAIKNKKNPKGAGRPKGSTKKKIEEKSKSEILDTDKNHKEFKKTLFEKRMDEKISGTFEPNKPLIDNITEENKFNTIQNNGFTEEEKNEMDLINKDNVAEETNQANEFINNNIKTDEQKFEDFRSSFETEDINKINESKDKIDAEAEEKKRSEEENNSTDNEEVREKRKYTKRKNYQIENDEQDIRDNAAMFFNGSLLLSLMDFIFPNAIKFIYTKFLKNKSAEKITHSQLVMTPDQIESLGDIPDKVSRIIFAKVNPIVLFFIFYTVMSFMNFRMALDNQEKLDKIEGGKK